LRRHSRRRGAGHDHWRIHRRALGLASCLHLGGRAGVVPRAGDAAFCRTQTRPGEGKTAEAAKRPSVRDIVNLFRIPEYVLVVLGYTAYTFALGAFGHWGPTFLHRAHGVAVD